jgi:hypothetical protein
MSAGLEEPCLPLPDRKAKEGQVGRNKPISINLGDRGKGWSLRLRRRRTAQRHRAILWTQDEHLEDLPGVKFFPKR